MADSAQRTPFELTRPLSRGDLVLRGDCDGEGRPVVLLHGLSATRRNVVQGSRYLARHGRRLISYDARGHGESSPPPDSGAYEYEDLVADLEWLLDALALERPVLAGSSMGAAVAMAFALRHPDRVPALVQITPAYDGGPRSAGASPEYYDRLADALERDGIEGFVRAGESPQLPERWREATRTAIRQRMERHRNLDAVATALRVVPRSRPFDGLAELERLEVPTLVVASRDEADPVHAFTTARAYADRLPRAELVVEDEGQSPLAWQGSRLSHAIEEFLDRVGG